MQKKLILDSDLLNLTIERLCQQLVENHLDFSDTVILGLQPRGIALASRIANTLKNQIGVEIPLGKLDITFHRDDFGRRDQPLKASETKVPFLIENKNVILVDDVLFSGRSVRAAMDAMITFGRPKTVELLVLVDRKYSRELPIDPLYVGRQINSMLSQKVIVELEEEKSTSDKVWLITYKEE